MDKYLVVVLVTWAYVERRYALERSAQLQTYGDLIRRHREEHAVDWLTGALLNAALGGRLQGSEYAADPVFEFEVPQSCDGVPPGVLNPAGSWPSPETYTQKYRQLAARFIENFKKFADQCPPEVMKAGPRL
ncbi:MAG TPA: hypothetical protein VI793_22055 [Anaerolineales bacterium]|nr:hypothetical protein [Anaerolineales bacterium]